MKQIGLSYFSDTHLTLLGLFVFFCYFVYLVIHVYWVVDNDYFDKVSHSLLEEGEGHE